MAESKALKIDIDKVLRDKAGTKAKYVPRFAVNWLKRIAHQDELNAFMAEHQHEEGVKWLRSTIEHLDIKLVVKGMENLPQTDSGPCTFVSNHPLGGIDGVALGMILGEHYDGNIRYLLNDILMNVPGLRPLGVAVNVTGAQDREIFRKVDEVFRSDFHVIVFPAQLCSRLINGKVQDLPWKKAVIQKSIQTQRNIVPIHFSGQNSRRFYRIANISKALGLKFNLAMLFLVDELYRNRGQQFEVNIGKPIPWQTFDKSRTHTEWAQWLRQTVYDLKS